MKEQTSYIDVEHTGDAVVAKVQSGRYTFELSSEINPSDVLEDTIFA